MSNARQSNLQPQNDQLRDYLQTRFGLQMCFWQTYYFNKFFSCQYIKIQIFLTKSELLTSGFIRTDVKTGHVFLHSNKICCTATSSLATARNTKFTTISTTPRQIRLNLFTYLYCLPGPCRHINLWTLGIDPQLYVSVSLYNFQSSTDDNQSPILSFTA